MNDKTLIKITTLVVIYNKFHYIVHSSRPTVKMSKMAIRVTLSSRNVTYNAVRIIKMQETGSRRLRRKLNIAYR